MRNLFQHRETGDMFLEMCPENKRDKPTLEALIIKRVRPGTHIITDGWAAYKDISRLGLLDVDTFLKFKLGYTWSFVNHSNNFKDPETGDHTNSIEGRWVWFDSIALQNLL